MNEKMMIYNANWYGKQTFKMLPVGLDCPFNEVIFDPNTKVLAIVSKDKKVKPQMMPKLTDKGLFIPSHAKNPEHSPYVEQRIMMESYYEYYIENIDDMKEFINRFAINPTHPSLKVIDAVDVLESMPLNQVAIEFPEPQKAE